MKRTNFNAASDVRKRRLGQKLLAEVGKDAPDNRTIVSLIDRGADLEVRDAEKNTPLLVAVKKNHTDAALILISSGANVAVYDSKDQPPLLHAVNRRNLDILERLFERDAPDGNPAGDSRIGQDRWDDYIWSLQCEIRKRNEDRKGISLLKPIRFKPPGRRPRHWNGMPVAKSVRFKRG